MGFGLSTTSELNDLKRALLTGQTKGLNPSDGDDAITVIKIIEFANNPELLKEPEIQSYLADAIRQTEAYRAYALYKSLPWYKKGILFVLKRTPIRVIGEFLQRKIDDIEKKIYKNGKVESNVGIAKKEPLDEPVSRVVAMLKTSRMDILKLREKLETKKIAWAERYLAWHKELLKGVEEEITQRKNDGMEGLSNLTAEIINLHKNDD